jgi:hypothetical protein
MLVMTLSHVGFAGIESAIQNLVNLLERLCPSLGLGRHPWFKLHLAILGQANGFCGFENTAFINGMDRLHNFTSTTLIRGQPHGSAPGEVADF